nr:response regulator transcription factor [Phycicoccus avicenniae]
MSATVIRVFLLDDHELVRRGVIDLLESEPDVVVVGESGSAEDAVHRIPALRPDVMVLDARLPDGSGPDVCRRVRAVDPSIAGLVLTSYDDADALAAAVAAGAADYVLKDVRGADLVGAVRRAAAGANRLSPDLVDRLRHDWEPPEDPRLAALTPQERRVLAGVAEGLTNREIGTRLYLSEKTVKNYMTSILAKLGLERRAQAVALLAGHHV